MTPANADPPDGDDPSRSPRPCRRCGTTVVPQRHEAENGATWIWRCACGWSVARTDSGVVSRTRTQHAIERARERNDDS